VVGCEVVTLANILDIILSSTITEEVLVSVPDYSCSCPEAGITNSYKNKCRDVADQKCFFFDCSP